MGKSLNDQQANNDNITLPIYSPKVFEQYEYNGWLITIEDYRRTDELIGFATPKKYAHLLNVDNYDFMDEIAKENGIKGKIDDDGYEDFGDFQYIILEPGETITWLKGVNMKSPSCILEDMAKEIFSLSNPSNNNNNIKYIVLKQVKKIAINPKTSQKHRGFFNVAWSSLVKLRDGKCTQCSSVHELHAHHIKQYKSHPELRYDVSNGITLCGNCHRKFHSENGK